MAQPQSFAAFDIDGTLIRWQLYHAITDMLARQGLLDEDTYASLKAARMDWKRRSSPEAFKAYEAQVVAAYEQALQQMTVTQFEMAAREVFDEYKDQVYSYTRGLIKELKSKNYKLLAISGSQTEIVAMMAAYYGFDDYVGTTYHRESDRFTGKVTLHAGSKHVILDELVRKHNLTYANSIAVGDSEGDVSMLEAVENPIAFNPTSTLLDIAKRNAWPIVIERKNVTYKLEPADGKYILA